MRRQIEYGPHYEFAGQPGDFAFGAVVAGSLAAELAKNHGDKTAIQVAVGFNCAVSGWVFCLGVLAVLEGVELHCYFSRVGFFDDGAFVVSFVFLPVCFVVV